MILQLSTHEICNRISAVPQLRKLGGMNYIDSLDELCGKHVFKQQLLQ